ncbi:MAG: NAD(P)H-dependent oxidoreductase [Bacteroidota bacterium]|nr:NAD(P)H-dependent oxidoreductase [Bacteroidota bacterium]
MKHLVVFCHPGKRSFCNAILDRLVIELESVNAEVRVRDLYALDFDPVLTNGDVIAMKNGSALPDVREEQNHIRWADVITFIYPIWWTGMPALMKGYIDRVFSYGFAYGSCTDGVNGLLSSKKVNIINTMGTAEDIYKGNGMIYSMNQTIDHGIFEFCGMEVENHLYLGAVTASDEQRREEMLSKVCELVGTTHSLWF